MHSPGLGQGTKDARKIKPEGTKKIEHMFKYVKNKCRIGRDLFSGVERLLYLSWPLRHNFPFCCSPWPSPGLSMAGFFESWHQWWDNKNYTSLPPARPAQKAEVQVCALPYVTKIMLPGRKSSFRAGLRPELNRENLRISSPASFRPAGGLMLMFS